MDQLLQDIRYGFRQILSAKAVSMAAVLCITIGVGANTTLFSVVNTILLRPIPGVADSTGLVELGRMRTGDDPMDTMSYLTWRDVIDGTDDQLEIGLWEFAALAISGDDEPEVVLGYTVTPSYFSVLGLEPAMGRFFNAAEGRVEAAESLAVISHGLWQRRYASAPDIVGRTIRINGEPTTIVGVAPEGFAGHLSIMGGDVWVPLGMRAAGMADAGQLENRFSSSLLGIGRLKPGVSLETAQAAGSAVMAGLAEEFPRMEGTDVGVAPLGTLPGFIQFIVSLFLAALMVVVGLVLMIACINVAGMLLSRGVARRKEIAVRLAMGASRGRLIRQLLTESLLLFAIGGTLGVLIAVWATSLLGAMTPPTPPPFVFTFDVGVDQRVLGFTLLLTMVTGIVFGLGPALRATRPQLVPALKDETSGFRRSRLRGALVAGQVAMTVLLLVASGLFLRALVSARTIDPGFNPDGVVTLSLDLELHGYEVEEGKRFYRGLREGLDNTAGIEVSSLAALLPLGLPANMSFGGVNVEGVEPPAESTSWDGYVNIVSTGYFETLEIPLLQGRDFDERDIEEASPVAIINEKMADHFWPDGDAVGKQFITGSFERGRSWQVIGVVRDSKAISLGRETPFFTYMSLEQSYNSQMSLQVRVRDAEAPPLAAIRGVVDRLDPDLPFMEVMRLREYVEVGFLPQRIAGSVAGIFGVVGLLLGAVGIYGVTAYAVSQRTREVGIRKALGAQTAGVMRLVIRQGMLAPLLGIAIGTGVALLVSRFLEAFLMGVSPVDPLTFAGVLALLAAVAFLANYLPARRAARTDPMVALRRD